MADENIIGAIWDLDITNLKAGLAESRKEITTANKQFNAATAGMDSWSTSTEGLKAKLTQLNTVLNYQKKNVAGLEHELEQAKKQYGENSEQVRRLNNQLLDAVAAVGRTEKAQRKYTAALQQVEQEEKEVASAAGKLTKALKETDTATVDLKGGFTVLKGTIANFAASALTSLVGGIRNAVNESKEFRQELGYLEQGADAAGVSFDKAKDKVKEVSAITNDQGAAVEGLNNLMASGFDGKALDTITEQLTGASIKWKDTLKFEGLADGLQETLATGKGIGQFAELLERGGLNLETFDEKMGGLTTEAQRQQYVMDTLSKLGLSEVTKGYREANKSLIEGNEANFEYSNSMAEIGERVEPVFTTIKQGWVDVLNAFLGASEGMDLETLKTSIQGAFQYFIDEIIPKIKEGVQFVLDNKDTILAAVVSLGSAFLAWKVVTIIQGVIGAVKAWMLVTQGMTIAQRALNLVMAANPIGLIVTLIAGLVAAFITLWNTSDEFRGFWIGLWEKIKTAVQPVIDFIKSAFAKAWEGIKIVWGVVAEWFKGIFEKIKGVFSPTKSALGNPFQNAWNFIKNIWKSVTNWFKTIFENIKKAVLPIDKALGSPFSKAWSAIKVVWNAAKGYFQLIWNNIKAIFSVVKSVLTGDFRGAWEGIKAIWNNSTSYFSGLLNDIFGYFKEMPSKLIQVGRDMIEGIKSGIEEKAISLANSIADAAKSALDAAKSALGINSPSKVFRDEVGAMIGEGIGVGILDSSKTVAKDIATFNKQLQGKVSQIKNGLAIPSSTVGNMGVSAGTGNSVVNNNYTQIINAPKQPSRIELYRQSKNLLALRGDY